MTQVQAAIEEDMLDVVLACRPIYSRNHDVSAFELLLQGDNPNQGATLSDIQATSPVILGTYTRLFQRGRVQSVPSFLKITDEVLMAPQLPELPKQQYILEVPEGMLLTSERVERLRDLAHRGYRLALAGYDPDDSELDALLEVVHIVKLDARRLDRDGLRRAAEKLRHFGVDLLADNLDNGRQFRDCMELGFTFYQGDFLSEPSPVRGKKITGNKLLLLQLLSELHNPDVSPMRLEEIALKDADLTFRILKVVNSVAVGLRREVDTLSHAIGLLGMEEVKRWANLFLVSNERDKPEALTRNMLVRGRMCEVLAEISGRDSAINHFIVGLLSQLDALMDISMPELMEQVPLSREVKEALLDRSGSLGEVLSEAELYEKGRFSDLTLLADKRYYEVAYRHSTAWARQVQEAMTYRD